MIVIRHQNVAKLITYKHQYNVTLNHRYLQMYTISNIFNNNYKLMIWPLLCFIFLKSIISIPNISYKYILRAAAIIISMHPDIQSLWNCKNTSLLWWFHIHRQKPDFNKCVNSRNTFKVDDREFLQLSSLWQHNHCSNNLPAIAHHMNFDLT